MPWIHGCILPPSVRECAGSSKHRTGTARTRSGQCSFPVCVNHSFMPCDCCLHYRIYSISLPNHYILMRLFWLLAFVSHSRCKSFGELGAGRNRPCSSLQIIFYGCSKSPGWDGFEKWKNVSQRRVPPSDELGAYKLECTATWRAAGSLLVEIGVTTWSLCIALVA